MKVYYDEIADKIILVSLQNHLSFGVYFYPAHNLIFLGEL